jgi:aminoglycoside 6'-N-acetyltransferase
MNITFISLTELHFPLLLKWLTTEHVKAWWDKDINWTRELIRKKYTQYIEGHKSIDAYIICADAEPIGYIQYYNVHDFPRDSDIPALPPTCASLDWYIGEPKYLGKGVGTKALELFINEYIFTKFDSIFVDPDKKNLAAIRAYEKVGFALWGSQGGVDKNITVPMVRYKHI